jgi:Tfp pilus assembly protein PilF
VRWAFTTGDREDWHPLVAVSHMLDCDLFGLEAGGHHLTNILLHMANVLLLFAILDAMTKASWPSAWVASMFAVHPLNVEAVAWVSARKDVLSTFFGLLSVAAYVAYAHRGGTRRYLLTAVLLALGLMAKPMLVTLPFVFLLLDYWPLRRLAIETEDTQRAGRRREQTVRTLVIEKLPLLALSVVSSIVALVVQRGGWSAPSAFRAIPIELRAANALVSYVGYLLKALWPTNRTVLYPHPYLPGGEPWSAGQVIGAAVVLVAVTALVLWARRHRHLPVGWFWYLGTLVPTIGLLQISGEAIADRFVYVPLIGIFIAVAWEVAASTTGVAQRHAAVRVATAATASAAVIGCMIVAGRQVRYWQSSATLYAHAVEIEPRSAIMQTNLASILAEQGQTDDAIQRYRIALDVDPLPAGTASLGNMLKPHAVRPMKPSSTTAAPPISGPICRTCTSICRCAADARPHRRRAIAHYERALALDPNHLGVERTRRDPAYALRLRQAVPAPAPTDTDVATPQYAAWAIRPPPRRSPAATARALRIQRQVIDCSSVYSSRPQRPPSRPMPLSLKPPKGMFSMLKALLMLSMPVRMRLATSRALAVSLA